MTKKNIENLLNFLDEIDSKIFNKLKKLDEIDFKLIKKFSSNNNTINSEKISKDKLVELILNSQLKLKLEKKEILDRFEKLDKLKIFK
jgi:hypothetical protein